MFTRTFKHIVPKNMNGTVNILRRFLFMTLLFFPLLVMACAPAIESEQEVVIEPIVENVDAPVNYNYTLDLAYAEDWLNPPNKIEYGDALVNQYAEPWLNETFTPLETTIEPGDALADLYAKPWLELMDENNCNGRLDIMYACQNRKHQR